jgi:hypothetical protein
MAVTKVIVFQQVLFCYNGDFIYILPFYVGLHSKWLTVTKSNLSKQEFRRNHLISSRLLKNAVFWDVVPCRSCVNRRFGDLHGATSQKTAFFIVTAVKTLNLIYFFCLRRLRVTRTPTCFGLTKL